MIRHIAEILTVARRSVVVEDDSLSLIRTRESYVVSLRRRLPESADVT